MDNALYLKEFQGRVKTMETYGRTFGQEPGLLKKELSTAADPDNPTKQEQAIAKNRYPMQFKPYSSSASLILKGILNLKTP